MWILASIHALWSLAAALLITRQKENPAVAAAWWLCIVLFPVAGTLLYLLAGWRRVQGPPPDREAPDGGGIVRLVERGGGSACSRHNRIELLHNGNNAFSALIAALQRASRSIHMEYYIFRNDRIGTAIAELLMRKARAGVEVRVLFDAVGSWSFDRAVIGRLRRSGVEVHAFAPLRFPWFTPSAARRNHRKIVVTDGRTAFLGGINIAKYYLDGDTLGRWRDVHLRIEGDAVADLQRIFIDDWRRAGGETLHAGDYVAPHRVERILPLQIVRAEEGLSRRTLCDALTAAILQARHRIRICTPYFLPPPQIVDALRIALRCGVRTQLMIPSCSDSQFTDLASESFVERLLGQGAEVYRYTDGFLHAKLLIVDDRLASAGTANMDYRSLEDNLEVSAFIYGREKVLELARCFDRDAASCRRAYGDDLRRGCLRRATSELLRLLAPLL